MKKFNILLIALILSAVAASAQPSHQSKSFHDEIIYEGYTIGILPAEGGTYGYIIFKNKKTVLVQNLNPFNQSKKGLQKKDDAYKVAKWQVQQLKPEDLKQIHVNRSIPGKVAKDLAISIN